MKKIFIFFTVLAACIGCYANEISTNNQTTDGQEIHLDLNTGFKEYNLNKKDLRNNPEPKTDDDDDMPFEMMTSPLRILKQYQQYGNI